MPETLLLALALALLLLALDGAATLWGEDSRGEFEDRNW